MSVLRTMNAKNAKDGRRPPSPRTLGDVLYADQSEEPLAERDWVVLVNYVAAGDQRALRQLFERTHRLVFSLIAKITHSRATADDLTVGVFQDIWRKAPAYDPSEGSVVGWIMSQARTKAARTAAARAGAEHRRVDTDDSTRGATSRCASPRSGGRSPCSRLRNTGRSPSGRKSRRHFVQGARDDEQHDRVSMLVRLAPGASYLRTRTPESRSCTCSRASSGSTTASSCPGDYNRAEPGTSDSSVWSETGCTCVLMTSSQDRLLA